MHAVKVTTIGIAALAVLAGACNNVGESPNVGAGQDVARNVDAKAELQRERDDDVSHLEKRVAEIEREYSEANQKIVSGKSKATAGLREELKEDVTNVKKAVSDLRTTTPENWWERHEEAMKRTADDIQADVLRLAGKTTPTPAKTPNGRTEEAPSSAPFTSRRDAFVADLRSRVDSMERALDGVKARGAQETELEDTRARVKKLEDDVDRLRSASANDWWDVSKVRVTEYLDRVEASVNRLDDDKS